MPSGQNKRCTICSAAADVLSTIETRLRDGTELRVIEAESGFSRSALDRHRNKCMKRAALVANRDRKINLAGKRMLVELPTHPLTGSHRFLLGAEYDSRGAIAAQPRPGQEVVVPETDLRGNDIVIAIEFEDAVAPRSVPPISSEDIAVEPPAETSAATMDDVVVEEPEQTPVSDAPPVRPAPEPAPEPPPDKFTTLFGRVSRLRLPWD